MHIQICAFINTDEMYTCTYIDIDDADTDLLIEKADPIVRTYHGNIISSIPNTAMKQMSQ